MSSEVNFTKLTKAEQGLMESISNRDSAFEETKKNIKNLETKVIIRFEQEQNVFVIQERKLIEKRVFKLLEDKFNIVKQDISRETYSRENAIEEIKNTLKVH